MHPLVKDYLEVFNFDSELLPSSHYPQTPIVKAILNLKAAILNKIEPAIAIASAEMAVIVKEENIELVLIFLETWFRLAVQKSRLQESEAILNRIRKIPVEGLLPEFRIIEKVSSAINKALYRNLNEYILKMTEAIEILPKQSIVYKRIFFKLCIAEALRGRLNKYIDQISEIKRRSQDETIHTKIKMLEFMNSVEQAEYLKARDLLVVLEKNEAFTQIMKESGAVLKNIQKIFHDYFENNVTQANKKNILKDQLPWVQSTYSLLLREPESALKYAKEDFDFINDVRHIGFISDIYIRAELSCRNHEAARWILQQKEQEGNFIGFENFYLARIEILAGNLEKAKYYLRKLKEFVLKYGFEKRIEIELDLACELNLNQYNRLLKECDQVESTRITLASKVIRSITKPNLIFGKSEAMILLKSQIEKLAPLSIPILITGETGTGKDLVARSLHDSSPRAKEPYLAINCAAISENLLQSELFGYEKGAFTGALSSHKGIIEEAGKGTVFLDEIGDISQQLQIALLRLLENGEYRLVGGNQLKKMSCRVIAATNAPLENLVENNTFRKDLFYRLERFLIHIPPLRERKADISALAFYFLQLNRDPNNKITLSAELLKALELHQWPGNVRELRNVMERMRFLNSNKLQFNLSELEKDYLPTKKKMLLEDNSGFFPVVNLENNQPSNKTQINIENNINKENVKNQSHHRLDTLKRMFMKYEKLSKTEAAKALNISLGSISNDLNKLLAEGFITKIEPSTAQRTHYYQIIKTK